MQDSAQVAGPSRRRANSIPIRPIPSLETSLAAPLTRLLSHPDAAVLPPTRVGSALPTITSTPSASRPSSPPHDISPYPGSGTPEDPYLVDWLPDEPSNPYNWRSSFKWMNMAVIAMSALCISFASSSYSAAIPDVMRQFNVGSREEGIAGLSLYVLGMFAWYISDDWGDGNSRCRIRCGTIDLGTYLGDVGKEMGLQCVLPPLCNFQHGRRIIDQYADAACHAFPGRHIR